MNSQRRNAWVFGLVLVALWGCPDSRRPEPSTAASTLDADVRDGSQRDADAGDAGIDPSQIGQLAVSCGAPSQGLIPVDCTASGDVGAYCVFGNHCACTGDFRCAATSPTTPECTTDGPCECEPGVICVPR
jgi:hypothetical protein